jgi:hypothetical protein
MKNTYSSVIKHGWEIPEVTKVFMGPFPINGGCSIEIFDFQMVNHLKTKSTVINYDI